MKIKVGTKIWFAEPDNWLTEQAWSDKVISVELIENEIFYHTNNSAFCENVFGKTVFLTKKEAQKELDRQYESGERRHL